MARAGSNDLYGGLPPFERESETSEEAALSLVQQTPNLREHVLDVLRKHPYGLTSEQVEDIMSLRHQTVSARLRELYLLGRVWRIGTRRNQSGKRAVVHQVASDPVDGARTS